ncbi:MAG: type II secretion system protein [Candidatus Zixiibacteriota bacterium]|nr:MAG: type II secretion system protein [candidate division Zixibacteria bacterium]
MKNRKRQSGFTLIEVMAGMVIIAVGLLLLLPMMVTSMQANDFARGSTEASMLIKDKMEELKNMDVPASGIDSIGTVTRTWTVTDLGNNLYQLDVNIGWTDRHDRAHNNTVTSYMSKR